MKIIIEETTEIGAAKETTKTVIDCGVKKVECNHPITYASVPSLPKGLNLTVKVFSRGATTEDGKLAVVQFIAHMLRQGGCEVENSDVHELKVQK